MPARRAHGTRNTLAPGVDDEVPKACAEWGTGETSEGPDPEYLTVQFPELTIGGPPGAFAARNQDTAFLRALPPTTIEKLILLPLPPDAEDRAYMARVYSRFPQGELKETQDGEWSFAVAPIKDLEYLFAHL
jgi:hypothetical protein